jgi:hypothetical protein
MLNMHDFRNKMPPGNNGNFVYQAADSGTVGDYTYYGETNYLGNWVIIRQGNSDGTYRYAKGTDGYVAAWAGKAGLSYDYFHNIF